MIPPWLVIFFFFSDAHVTLDLARLIQKCRTNIGISQKDLAAVSHIGAWGDEDGSHIGAWRDEDGSHIGAWGSHIGPGVMRMAVTLGPGAVTLGLG